MRAVWAHFAACFLGALIITAGFECIGLAHGFCALSGAAKWVGGFLIWAVIGVFALPFALLLRRVAAWFSWSPRTAALSLGAGIGVALIPVLHPGMSPAVSMSTHPISLLALHLAAGIVGGFAWYAVDDIG